MRCKYCDGILNEWEYVWNGDIKEFVETGQHTDGNCVGGPTQLDLPLFVEEQEDGED